jgi:luciferase family oxidoreductase group 1
VLGGYRARMIPLSVLDPVFVREDSSPGEALADSLALARHVEQLGYGRFWVAEHHNKTAIASAATAVVVAHLAAGTSTIRVGAGGIMLPNHAPLIIAEQFGTLASLHPGRIDLGLGRAPGTDGRTAQALRRDPASAETFPQDVQELQAFLGPVAPGQLVQAVPGGGTEVPLWILGSSTYGAQLAALLGLPYAFASHFSPDALTAAMRVYREQFQPSKQLQQPYAMAGINVFAAETDDEARRLFTSQQLMFADLLSGRPGPLRAPVDDIEQHWAPAARAQASHMLTYSVVGSPETVRAGLEDFVALAHPDELMVVSAIFDPEARRRSHEILMDVAPDAVTARGDAVGSRG